MLLFEKLASNILEHPPHSPDFALGPKLKVVQVRKRVNKRARLTIPRKEYYSRNDLVEEQILTNSILQNPKSEAITMSLVKMIAVDMLPLSFVEGPGLLQFLHTVCPDYTVPSRTVIRDRLQGLYDAQDDDTENIILIKETLEEELKNRFLSNSDVTSCGLASYLDPRYKDLANEEETYRNKIKEKLMDMTERINVNEPDSSKINERDLDFLFDPVRSLSGNVQRMASLEGQTAIEKEMLKYDREPTIPKADNPLLWWNSKGINIQSWQISPENFWAFPLQAHLQKGFFDCRQLSFTLVEHKSSASVKAQKATETCREERFGRERVEIGGVTPGQSGRGAWPGVSTAIKKRRRERSLLALTYKVLFRNPRLVEQVKLSVLGVFASMMTIASSLQLTLGRRGGLEAQNLQYKKIAASYASAVGQTEKTYCNGAVSSILWHFRRTKERVNHKKVGGQRGPWRLTTSRSY
ncbi:hypothetical protein EVAR_86141_1 [Eumeta japonica]|uniref:Uncharacterized protein n=1 Tax=Eumeta variegata TaxID=151549 RepID=A0A4C1V0L9_EUMVA|nr:hypothetical protein EVAR_86141_1 [Eumeta japonica]